MQLEQRVRDGVERIGEIAPLSPMAKLEIDGVLTALCETVATESWSAAFEVAARCAERRGSREVAAAIRALIPTGGAAAGEPDRV